MLIYSANVNNKKTYLDSIEQFDCLEFGRGKSSIPRCIDILSSSELPSESSFLIYSGVSSDDFDGFLYVFKRSDEQTTDTELAAIAADAIHGCNTKPNELNAPAANGIPSKLYMLAKKKFKRIRRTVRLDKSKQATTSSKSF